MEEDQSSVSARSSSKLVRYPLRSATKSKDAKSPLPVSATCQRGKPPSSVSQSMSVLDLSGKGKSVKPARRLSIPTKSTVTPAPKSVGCITPISEVKSRRSAVTQAKSDTPVSDVSRSSNRKKFTILSSASYWLNQIKLAESAAKHSISLAFFKVAYEAGCEPLQRMREELKNYVRKHDLAEFENTTKQLFESYNIVKSFEQMQVSETISHALEEGTQSSDDNVHSSSTSGTRKLKPKSLNPVGGAQIQGSVDDISKKISPAPRIRSSAVTRGNTSSKSTSIAIGQKTQNKNQKPSKENEKHKVKKQEKKLAAKEATPKNSSVVEKPFEENKENMDAPQLDEISMIES
ncbi:uncharacterized protein LOC141688964 [Apium graveolens]|uniref:uncharacterized protein LOC141688964 n=1 Tax=Apium graveolens TaxID=4045 RepID=UPI003D7A85BB